MNGKSFDKSFHLTLPISVTTINRLKMAILKKLNIPNSPTVMEKMKIFNIKGIEIDDMDIEYLTHKQVLYLSLDGTQFNMVNYVNEYKFLYSIKSGGYGKVFAAESLLTGDEFAIKEIDVSNLCKYRSNY